MSLAEQQPHRRRLVDLIRRIAVDGFGAEEVQRVAYPGATFTVAALADGLSGLRAAAIAQSVARSQLYEYAAQARGAGSTWRGIAEALGIGEDHGVPAELAYELIVEGRAVPRTRGLWRPAARWTCTSCERSISDTGPYDGAPVNNEAGHEEACPRLAEEPW
ncbi:hypothetical protein [Pseudonocardia sp. WMMC193]|uniref:hypothetical protein n=1 Tax=Pseudonocardia sp. WMMC193 TaxID=2911965 RepID=UPI001F2F313C|nr:hypothetical protein [Pseudonocardia sp. WMMC193]MCF7550908.1 hypothetical protein [Pseudonocardia sp. WMMC193]